MRTAIATAAAPTLPIRPRKGMPVTLSASSAMMTVEPANTTALPEVPVASAIDSATRVAVHELAAVAVDDEQRVVDPDREAEHHAEHRRHGHHLDDAGERHRAEHADGDAHERGDEGKAGRDERAEHDEQHDRGHHEAHGLARPHDLGHPGGDGRREVDLDSVDRRRRGRPP